MRNKWEIYDISSFYNSKGISWIKRGISASINHLNESLPGELLPNNEIVTHVGIPFHFPKTDSSSFDMLTLSEQQLDLPEGTYTQIAFIGFSTWGDYHDSILLLYADGHSHEVPFGFNDWQEFHSHNSEDTAKIVMEYHRLSEEQIDRQVKLELNIIKVDSNRALNSIVLPDNDFSYILSMSVLRSQDI